MQYGQDPDPPGQWPTHRRNITTAEVHPKKQEIKPHIGFPRPDILYLGYEPLESLALKTSRSCIWETQRAEGAEILLFKCMHKISHTLSPSMETIVWEAWVRPTCWSCRVSQRGRRQTETPTGDGDAVSSHFWKSFYHVNTSSSRQHFGILPLHCVKGIPPHQWTSTSPVSLWLFGPHSQPCRGMAPPMSDQHQPRAKPPPTSSDSQLDEDTAPPKKGLAPDLQPWIHTASCVETWPYPPVALQTWNEAESHSQLGWNLAPSINKPQVLGPPQ